jgi:hypothetical protein
MKLTAEMFRPGGGPRPAGLVLAELVRTHGLNAKPTRSRRLFRGRFDLRAARKRRSLALRKPERLGEFEAPAVEANVAAGALGRASVVTS